MQDKLRLKERRKSARRSMSYPVIYTRFDHKGRPFEQKPSRLMNVSPGGVRVESSFPAWVKEVLELSIALRDKLITFMGKVTNVTLSPNEDFEMGVSIEKIHRKDRMILTRFINTYTVDPNHNSSARIKTQTEEKNEATC